MTKDVIITIKGLQMIEGDQSSPVELITAGEYYYKNGKHYLFYDEVTEEFGGVTKNQVKIGEDCMDISKRGVSNVHMIFERDKKNLSSYQTPYGNLVVGFDARQLRVEEEEDHIDIEIEYDLDVNYEHLAECSLTMNIRPRDTVDFSV